MKTRYYLLIMISLVLVSCVRESPKWTLVWEENFDQEQLDTTIWSYIPREKSEWCNYMASYKELYELKNGVMTLYGVENKTHPNDTAKFLTGGIWTRGKQSFEYGRVEVKAKFDCAQGFWPAIWMVPDPIPYPYGGEVDIMEHLNHDTIVYQTLHSHYSIHLKKDTPKRFTTVPIDKNKYNVYAVELYKDSVCFFTNGVKTLSYPKVNGGKDGQFPFAYDPFYLYLDAQLGGGWVGKVENLQLPVRLMIDWVRYYKKK